MVHIIDSYLGQLCHRLCRQYISHHAKRERNCMEFTRRQFLGKTATAVIVAGTMATGKVFGANNRIRMCTIGFNGQGGSHLKDILGGMKDEAEYVALCDVDATV